MAMEIFSVTDGCLTETALLCRGRGVWHDVQ